MQFFRIYLILVGIIGVAYAIVWAVRKYLIYRDSKRSYAYIAKNIKFGLRIRYIDRLSKTTAPIIGRVIKCDYQRRYVMPKPPQVNCRAPRLPTSKRYCHDARKLWRNDAPRWVC